MATILAISGSLRKSSYNTALLRTFKEQAPSGTTIDIVESSDIAAFPLYDQDGEAAFPPAVTALKERIRAADGIIIATPEYNRSIPGVLKNLIDWTSRPYGKSAWAGKPVYVMGASMGPLGASLAQYALKQVMLHLDARVIGQPEFFLGTAQDKFDEAGKLTDQATKDFINSALMAFTNFIGK